MLNSTGIVTYGINNGVKTYRPKLWGCVDSPDRFLKSIWLDPTIHKFVPQSQIDNFIFDSEKWKLTDIQVKQCPSVTCYKRNDRFDATKFLIQDTINWGNSKELGGCRSVMLPTLRICHLLGFKTIYLLGADFKMDKTTKYHFNEQRTDSSIKCNNKTYDRLKEEYLPQLKPEFDKVGVKIYNCNPESELKVFDFMPYEDAIRQASTNFIKVKDERSYGLYTDLKDRDKAK
jgi:hypothetical protein